MSAVGVVSRSGFFDTGRLVKYLHSNMGAEDRDLYGRVCAQVVTVVMRRGARAFVLQEAGVDASTLLEYFHRQVKDLVLGGFEGSEGSVEVVKDLLTWRQEQSLGVVERFAEFSKLVRGAVERGDVRREVLGSFLAESLVEFCSVGTERRKL